MPAHPRPASRLRLLTVAATIVALSAGLVALLLAPTASGDRDRRFDTARAAALRAASATYARSLAHAPLARASRCDRPAYVVGVGRACRDATGMLLLPTADREILMSHGPDLVDATPGSAAADGGFGTTDSIICSAPSASRHVVLAYLIPSDFASGVPGVHGDRSAEVVPQLRQALLDAAAMVDRRAGELAPGTRRRMRVACGADGQPIVERVVLPRIAAEYLSSSGGGFTSMESDLDAVGFLPDYVDFSERHLPSVRRVLAYYDADFHRGVAGQGVLFPRATMIARGTRPTDPIVSRTVRNINNNPPSATFAVQYGTSYDGVPDPPLYTSLLHELSHTLGAVQDEPPTASDAGHCLDGLDIMCYSDGGPAGTFSATVCPDATPESVTAADELFDCNGDTYFHPAPPAGNPLAGPTTWNLGLLANELLSPQSTVTPPPPVTGLTVAGRGTQLVLRWNRVPLARGYDVAVRSTDGTWNSTPVRATTTAPSVTLSLRARADHEFVVVARDARAVVGRAAVAHRRTGPDTSPPVAPGRPVPIATSRSTIQLRFPAATDNERVTKYLLERRVRTRWVSFAAFTAPAGEPASRTTVTSPVITQLQSATEYVLRLRALDARGNRSLPSAVSTAFTRR